MGFALLRRLCRIGAQWLCSGFGLCFAQGSGFAGFGLCFAVRVRSRVHVRVRVRACA